MKQTSRSLAKRHFEPALPAQRDARWNSNRCSILTRTRCPEKRAGRYSRRSRADRTAAVNSGCDASRTLSDGTSTRPSVSITNARGRCRLGPRRMTTVFLRHTTGSCDHLPRRPRFRPPRDERPVARPTFSRLSWIKSPMCLAFSPALTPVSSIAPPSLTSSRTKSTPWGSSRSSSTSSRRTRNRPSMSRPLWVLR